MNDDVYCIDDDVGGVGVGDGDDYVYCVDEDVGDVDDEVGDVYGGVADVAGGVSKTDGGCFDEIVSVVMLLLLCVQATVF